jgi:hypothetical protein
MKIKIDLLQNVLEKCFEVGLFDAQSYQQKQVLTSNGVLKRAAIVMSERSRKNNCSVIPADKMPISAGKMAITTGKIDENGGKITQSKRESKSERETKAQAASGNSASIQNIFDFWQEHGSIKEIDLSPEVYTLLETTILTHGEDTTAWVVKRYCDMLADPNWKIGRAKYRLWKLLTQKFDDFTDNGEAWINYSEKVYGGNSNGR